MILDEITLHNFGVYGGRQSMALTPTGPNRPIVLIGGLNGGGKTTLLDALQLCLFGQAARCSNRNGLAYDDFLRRSLHRGADTPEAALEIAFRHTSNGVEQSFRLHRSWTVSNAGVRERFHVMRDGHMDKIATDHWAEQVEDFIPSRIAHLFFFDGEKVESYADLDGAPALIATAIHNLLGLDLVERLTADLLVLERRRRVEAKPAAERVVLDDLKAKIRALEVERQDVKRDQGALMIAVDRAQADLKTAQERYQREGGALFEQRADLDAEASASATAMALAHKELREVAAGVAPLLLVRPLLRAVETRDETERATRRARETLEAIEDEHRALVALPELVELSAATRDRVARALQARTIARRDEAARPTHIDLGLEARGILADLIRSELPVVARRLAEATSAEMEIKYRFEAARVAAAAAPSSDTIAPFASARDALRDALASHEAKAASLEETLIRLDRELSVLRASEQRLIESDARERFEQEDIRRLLSHSNRVRVTLGGFREAVVERHVARIEGLVLESFQRLVRKRALVTGLTIDPRTFTLELRGADGRVLTPDRLSAGERQLLAIAILWGLARASGRPLPTVIDTPLGRLDSIHREHLVKRYFPHASHQVLLLSTDEEIAGGYLDALRPAVDRMYRLSFDEERARTVIEPGYFSERFAEGGITATPRSLRAAGSRGLPIAH